MARNPPNNPTITYAQRKTFLAVYIAEDVDTKPTENDEQTHLRVESIMIFAGSGLAEAVLIDDLAAHEKRIEDRELRAKSTRQVEIWTINTETSTREKCLFWGEITAQQIELRTGEESNKLVAQVMPYHFGTPIVGMLVYDKHDAETRTVHHDPEFNPVVNQALSYNRFLGDNNPEDFPIWLDPDSAKTTEAEDWLEASIARWTLHDIVETLLNWLNADEKYLENPNRRGIEKQIKEQPEVVDLSLPRGQYLPALLDAVLQPYGYNWYVKIYKDGDGEAKPAIYFYKRGTGEEKTVDLQKIDEDYERAKTNLEALSLKSDVSSIANKVTGYGALYEKEMTLELYRAWAEDEDGNEDHNNAKNHVGRKFAANEGADYFGIRLEIIVPDLGSNFIVRRRVMEPCLTTRDGDRILPVLQYKLNGEGWTDAPQSWAFRYLPNEIGIYFTATSEASDAIPAEVLESDTQLRITCTLASDVRMQHTKDSTEDSLNASEVELILDLSNRFQSRKRETTGDYKSVLTGSADEQDDFEDFEEFVDKIGVNEQSAHVTAEISLHGIITSYEIGNLLTEVKGRNLSFNRNASSASEKRYLQIVGITYQNLPDQHTILTVTPYDVA